MSAEDRAPATIDHGEPVDLPGRAHFQPQLFRVSSHAKIPSDVPTNNIYMYLEDTQAKSMEAKYAASRKATLPRGEADDIRAAGYAIIGPGDYVICRDMWGSGQEQDDDIVMYVPSSDIIEPFRGEMDAARAVALGDSADRDQQKARLDEEGVWRGGIAFERSDLAVNVEGAERCYTLGQSYQVQRKLTGPSVGAKVEGEILNHHKMRQNIMKASARVGIATLEAGDENLCDALREQADCINLPRLGDSCNYAFPTMQLNIASTQKVASGSGSLQNELGGFGVPHADENDSPAGMTVLIANSELSDGVKPGHFLNVELGIAVELSGFVTCCFSGLRQHGGYPPMDFTGGDPEAWSYRFVVVCYPPKQMLEGDSSLALGALPQQKLFKMPPEMIHPRFDEVKSVTNNASWIISGPIMTDPEAYLQWYYQSQCQQLAFFHRQVKVNSDMHIDLDALANVFYLQHEDGSKTYPEPWALRPEEQEFPARRAAMRRWDAFKVKKSKFLPFLYRSGRDPVAAITTSSEDELGQTSSAPSESSKKRKQSTTSLSRAEASAESSNPKPTKRQKKVRSDNHDDDDGETQKQKKERRKPRPKNARKDWNELPYRPQEEGETRSADLPRESAEGRSAGSSTVSHSYNLHHSFAEDVQVLRVSTPDYAMAEDVMDDSNSMSFEGAPMASREEWQQEAENELSAQTSSPANLSSALHFQPVLDIFSLRGLIEEFEYVQGLASSLSKLSPTRSNPQAIEHFMQSFGEEDRMQPEFALQCAQMWPCHQARRSSADLFGLILAVERRDIMLASAMAWYWLTQDCASTIIRYASLLQQDSNALSDDTSWLARLTLHVWLKLSRVDSDRIVHPANYFPDCPSTLHALNVARHGADSSPNAVCVQVVTILRQWLNFPSNSELLSAYFVLRLVEVCSGNTDVLLLRGVWRPYKEVKAAILNMRKQRWSSLRLSHLAPFAEALQGLPIADASSTERSVLDRISGAIRTCAAYIPAFTDVTAAMRRMPSPYPLPPNNVPATALIASTGTSHAQSTSSLGGDPCPRLVTPQITQTHSNSSRTSRPSSSPRLDRESGLAAMVEFISDLLPLARGDSPTSAIQQLVASDPDRYLPFRNLAPTRLAVSKRDGPFHSGNVLESGAFASCVINRALTFNTPAAKENGNPTLFSSEEAWDAFKQAQNYSEGDPLSEAYFFNIRCYGSAQGTRLQGMADVGVYFSAEKDWKKLLSECGGKIPFMQFFRWAKQQVKRKHKKTNELQMQSRLPLVGKLTAYLLAADLSYAGVVESPSVEEVGAVIHKNRLGSLNGLWEIGVLSSQAAPEEEVVSAFREVVECLQNRMEGEDCDLVGFDAIMVEHALCKFQRVYRELPKFKGKGV